MSPAWYAVIVVGALALIALDVVLRKKGKAKDYSAQVKTHLKARFAVLAVVLLILLVAVAIGG
jgi:hypothetical protein